MRAPPVLPAGDVHRSAAPTPEWHDASGKGTVHTFTIIRQNHAKPFREQLPYVVAMVELDEGPRMMSNVIDCDVADVHIGLAGRGHVRAGRRGRRRAVLPAPLGIAGTSTRAHASRSLR